MSQPNFNFSRDIASAPTHEDAEAFESDMNADLEAEDAAEQEAPGTRARRLTWQTLWTVFCVLGLVILVTSLISLLSSG